MRLPANSLKIGITIIIMTAFSTVVFAETEYKYVESVEDLLNNIAHYDDKKVRVPGEVEEIDRHAFILESGGIFNDEIVVVMPKSDMWVKEDSSVIVSGTVRTMKLIDVGIEYGLDLEPEIEAELENREAFLIADHIAYKEEDEIID